MRVLLTGHEGYIGTIAVRVLTEAGHEVTGVDSGLYAECGFGTPFPPAAQIREDIRDLAPSVLAGFDAVVHLAALCNDPLGDLNPDLTADVNHRASVRLAKMSRDAGVKRFVFASSCSLYGSGGGDALLDENAPMRPLTPYAVSKVRVEEDVHALADADFTPVYLRNATAYGLSPRLRGDVVLNNFVGWAHTTGRIRILSDGTPWRPIVHIEDIAQACAACLEAPKEAIHNEAFNIGRQDENYRVRDLADIVSETVPGAVIEYAGDTSPDPRSYRVDFSKATRQLPEFKPKWTAREGAREMYDSLKAQDIDKDAFLGPRFTRLLQIRRLLEAGAVDDRLRWTANIPA